jgi:tripartite-type tricarboxylate transporter receptor subunit TctC
VTTWLGFVAPRGTPPEIIAAMAQATREALAVPEVAERLRSLGIVPVGSTPEQFAEVLRKDRALYVEAIRSAGIPLIEPAGQ